MPATASIRQLLVLSTCLLSELVGAQTGTQSVAASSSSVLDRLHSLLFRPARANAEPEQERIPKILHHIFLSGEKELRKAASGPDPPMRIEWSENCVHQHDGWQVMFWDMEASLQLLREEYPWFLDTFQGYKRRVQQGDAIRYFILNTHGGVYMDMDVECFRPTDSFLRGYDLVLNVELGEGVTVTNAVMASAPNITYWRRVFDKMQERKAWNDDFLETEVVATTGPWMLTDTLKEFLHIRARSAGEYIRPTGQVILQGRHEPPQHVNEVIKIYEVGAWFTPCIFDNEQCHLDLLQAKQNGTIDLSRLAGYHRYQGTWKPCMGECFKDIQHRTKGDQNPLQGMVGDVPVTSEPAAAEIQTEGGQQVESPAQSVDSRDGNNSSSSSSSSSQGEGSSTADGSSSDGESRQESSSRGEGQAEATPAPAVSLLKHGKAKKPHRRKAGS